METPFKSMNEINTSETVHTIDLNGYTSCLWGQSKDNKENTMLWSIVLVVV